MEILQFNLSEYALLKVALGATLLFLSLRLIRRILHFLFRSNPLNNPLLRNFPAIEMLLWFGLLLWGAGVVFKESLYNFFAVAVISTVFAFWLFWIAGRDWIAGILLRMQDTFDVGTNLQIGDVNGVVRKLGDLALELEDENGDRIQVPYRSIAGKVYKNRRKQTDARLGQMQIRIPAEMEADALQTLRRLLLNSPWVSVLKEPVIRPAEKEGQKDIFEIRAFIHPPGNQLMVENDIQKQLEDLHS